MITTVPFSGFYCTLHDEELDHALEQMFTDRDTGCHVNWGLQSRAFDSIDWQMVHEKYADAYVDAFADKFKVKLTFESLWSPREYNFQTDRIFAEIDGLEVHRIMGLTDPVSLTAVAKERFTSRSGFISHYDPDWYTWGPLSEWDHNQVGTLLLAYVGEEDPDFDQYAEVGLMEYTRDNGRYEEWFYGSAPKVHRLLNVRDYLEARSRRAA